MDTKICEACGDEKPLTNFNLLGSCKSNRSIRYRDHICRKCRRNIHRSAGLCNCGRPAAPGKTSCNTCLRYMNECCARRRIRDRKAAFDIYGSMCNYCGETIEPFLTIDHVNNDGAEHRRSQRAGGQGGHEVGAWLRKNKYPSGFQTLCFNCNCAKSKSGEVVVLQLLRENNRLTASGQARLNELCSDR